MLVKICGIKTIDAAMTVQEAGADFIGFVFAPSNRRISPIDAANITRQLSPKIKKVGVFVNESVENMKHITKLVGLDYVQLHGDEPAHVATQLPYPIIKAFSIHTVDPKTIHHYPCDYLLIDSPGEKYRGGSGKVFNWKTIEELQIDKRKLILAGGLNEANVQQAIESVRPIGVDISSGVETDGVKDHQKIQSFLKRTKKEITQKG
ncbi:phosphoribosylanthranilate isomerase [Pseudogracilibacillus sp. SO30301A]|uniref:phosphoribosylanthranilate isomerase n=1 Tax=Pseudogracilibacillus sp. SO30301A TaxID=3098291 RepID=UPI00300E6BD5